MSNLPFTLPTCDRPATVRIEVYRIVPGPLPGSLDASVYACTEHAADAVSAIEAADRDARVVPMTPDTARTCGLAGDDQGEHPRWCNRGAPCRIDGVHHSRPLPATTTATTAPMRVWLEQVTRPAVGAPMLVVEVAESGEPRYYWLPVEQGRVLAYQVRRLVDLSKGQR